MNSEMAKKYLEEIAVILISVMALHTYLDSNSWKAGDWGTSSIALLATIAYVIWACFLFRSLQRKAKAEGTPPKEVINSFRVSLAFFGLILTICTVTVTRDLLLASRQSALISALIATLLLLTVEAKLAISFKALRNAFPLLSMVTLTLYLAILAACST